LSVNMGKQVYIHEGEHMILNRLSMHLDRPMNGINGDILRQIDEQIESYDQDEMTVTVTLKQSDSS
jgi:hypothetical protein